MPSLAEIFGALQIPDDEYTYLLTYGQEAVFDATNNLITAYNADMDALERIFVDGSTDVHNTRYYLNGFAKLDKVTDQTRPPARKIAGSWDVAYPLEEWGARISGNRNQMAYMTTGQYGRHVQFVMNSDVSTRRYLILKAVFNNGGGAPLVFYDDKWGNLNVQPLANGDATLYPPLIGTEDNVTSNHYLVTGFLPGAISDTYDPLTPAVDILEGHLGYPTGGSNIVTFINKAQVAAVEALSLFNPVPYRFQVPGADVSLAGNVPDGLPGRVLGEYAGKALIVRWDWIPANYTWTFHLDSPPPLRRRVDPAATGLPQGLTLVSQSAEHPFRDAIWSHRMGYGVANRLNGVITYIATGTTYTTPAQFAINW